MVEMVLVEKGEGEGWMRRFEIMRGGAGDEGENGVDGMDERGMVRLKDASETEVPE